METIEPKYRILLCLEQSSLTYTYTLSVMRSHHCRFAILKFEVIQNQTTKGLLFHI